MGTLVVLLSFDAAHACRWLRSRAWCVSPCVTTVWSTPTACCDGGCGGVYDAYGDCQDPCAGCGDPSWVTGGDDEACGTEVEQRPEAPVTPQPKTAREPAADASTPVPAEEPQADPDVPASGKTPAPETPRTAPPAVEPTRAETTILDRTAETPTEAPVETPPAQQTPPPVVPSPPAASTAPDGAATATEAGPAAAAEDSPATAEDVVRPDSSPPGTEPQPDKKDTPDSDEDDSLEGLFDSARDDRPAGQQLRRWTDDTGRYSCRGRLVGVTPDHVRILKVNGHTTTVPRTRLSQTDLRFVRAVATLATRNTPTAQMAKK